MNLLPRRLWLLIFVLLFNNIARSQGNMSVSFTEFETIVKSLKVTGFPTLSEITEEEGEYAEYQAYYLSGNDMFSVKLEPRKGGPTWSSKPYLLDGRNSEFAVSGHLTMLFIDLPAIESILTLISNKIKDKQQLEQIARKTGLLERRFASLSWPDEILAAYRPDCVIVDIERVDSTIDGITTEYFLTVLMSDQLKQSVRKLRSQYEDNGHYVVFANKSVLTSQFGELDDLDHCCKNDDKVIISFQLP